jgi:anti-sigma B factor antagonist
MTQPVQGEHFDLSWRGDVAVITPAPEVESMSENLIYQAAEMVLAPLRKNPPAGLVVDLSKVKFFGSVFISFLLKCHMLAKRHGTEIVLAGASPRARELLHLTALDTLWALYDSLDEALESLGGSD